MMNPRDEYEMLLARQEELIKEREELKDELAPIKKQIVSAHMQRVNTGRWVRPEIYHPIADRGERVQEFIKKINVEILTIQTRMGKLRRSGAHVPLAEKNPMVESKRQLFVQVAQQQLSADVFERIWQIVEGRIKLMSEKELSDLIENDPPAL